MKLSERVRAMAASTKKGKQRSRKEELLAIAFDISVLEVELEGAHKRIELAIRTIQLSLDLNKLREEAKP